MPASTTPHARRTWIPGGLRYAAWVIGIGLLLSASAAYAHRPLNGSAGTSAAVLAEEAADYERVSRNGRPAQLDGSLQVLHEDYADGTGRYRYFLESQSERFQLHFNGEGTRHMTGERVRVTGRLDGGALAIESAATDVKVMSLNKGLSLWNTFGPQKTAVILINFANNPTQPYTPASARNVVFGTTSNFDLENSYGQTSLTGDVFGWYTIALSSTVCDYMGAASQARAAATAAGVNLAGYTRFVYAFPGNACGWWGLGTVGGNPSSAWINGSLQLAVVGHEMGHNFGLYHSHSLECGSVPVSTTCSQVEYGDQLDIMGNGSNHFNAFQKERLGWLDYGSSPPITTVTATGTYTIEALESPGTAPKALKIPIGGTGKYYYVELRRGVGFDANLGGNPNLMGGVVLHMAQPSNGDSSQLLDMTASSSWGDPALTAGTTYVDTTASISITPTAVTSTNATVSVTMSSTGCTRVNPTIALTPAQSAGVTAGTMVPYVATITNNDTLNCGASTFDVTNALPSGWTGTLSTSAVTLAPGASSTATLQVTSPTTAINGTYSLLAIAQNRGVTAFRGTGSANYVVANGTCTRANPTITLSAAPATSAAPGASLTYTLSVTNRDNTACLASIFDLTNAVPSGWSGTFAAPALALSAGATSSTTMTVYSATSAPAGTYTVNATAKNRSAATYVTTTSASYVVTSGTCTRANPTVTLSPGPATSAAPGAPLTYTLAVTNRDNAACSASIFDLTNAVPSGWTGTFATTALSLSAGATASMTMTVSSAATATAGTYTINGTARNRSATTYLAAASAAYVVTTGGTGGGTGGGTTGFFSDTFNRADSTSIGSNWTIGAGNFVIASNMLKNAMGSGISMAVVAGLAGATQTVTADFTSVDNNLGPRFGVVLRYQDAKNYYLVYRQTGGSSRLLISKFVNGVETVLSWASISNPAKLVPFRITGRISGNTIALDFNTTQNVVKVTDAAATFTTGKAGIMIGPGGSSVAQQQADNFTATVQ